MTNKKKRSIAADLTEPKAIDEEMSQERDLLRALVENLPDYVYVKDAASRFLLANEAVRRHLGAATIDDVIGKTDFDFSPAELAEQYYADEQAIFHSGQALVGHEEKIFDHETGTYRWTLTTKVPFHDASGKIIGLVGMNRDITDLKQAREAYQMLVDHSLQGFAIIQDDRIIFANRALARTSGYDIEELLALSPDRLRAMLHPEDRDYVWEYLQDQGVDKPPAAEVAFRFTRKDGTIRWVEAYASRIEFRGKTAVQVAFIDITERKQAEEQIQYQANLIENVSDAIISTDPEFVIQSWNEAAETIYGWAASEAIGQSAPTLLKTEFARGEREAAIRQLFDQGRWGGQVTQQHKDGTALQIFSSVSLIRNVEGNPAGVVAVNRNVTERKRMEKALQESEAFNQAVLNSLTAHIAVLAKDGTIVAVNEAWTRFADENGGNKLSARTGVGVNYLEVCCQARGAFADEAQAALAGIRAVLDGSLTSFLLEYPCHSVTTERWFIMLATPLSKDGGGAVISHVDITERNKTEQALRQSETRYRAIVEDQTELISRFRPDGTLTFVNKAYCRYFNKRYDELIGSNFLSYIPARERRIIKRHLSSLTGENPVGTIEHQVVIPNGEIHFQRRTDRLIFDESGAIIEIQAVGRDITDRKRAEEERVLLFEAISQQREQLRALTRRLTEVQETERKQLARELHDQVGQNLTALGLNLNIIRAQIPDDVPGAALLYDRIDDSLMLTEQTTERIRDVMANLRPPVLDDYGLIAALRWYGNRFSSWAGFTVTIQGDELTPRAASFVENTLFRIAQEALTNVAKHAHARQVKIDIDTDDEIIRMVIVDNGVGFNTSALAHPVDQHSWGLLSMIERAETIGGHCYIESIPEKGTEIIVEVPR